MIHDMIHPFSTGSQILQEAAMLDCVSLCGVLLLALGAGSPDSDLVFRIVGAVVAGPGSWKLVAGRVRMSVLLQPVLAAGPELGWRHAIPAVPDVAACAGYWAALGA